jgi:hypothetical protein
VLKSRKEFIAVLRELNLTTSSSRHDCRQVI